MLLINSMMPTVFPTPAPPNSQSFPPREYAAHPQWTQLEETSRSLRTKNQRPTKPSSRACQMQPQVHQATGKYSGAHQRARSLRRSEVTDRHGHYRCAVVTHRYLEAPLLGRCLRQSTLHINSHPAGFQGLCNGNARASPGSTLAIHGRDETNHPTSHRQHHSPVNVIASK